MTSNLAATQARIGLIGVSNRYPKAKVTRLAIEAYLLIADKIISMKKSKELIDMKKISDDLLAIILSDSNEINKLEESLKSEISKHPANIGLGNLISKLAPNLPYNIDASSNIRFSFDVSQAKDRLDLVRYYVSSNISDFCTICRVTQKLHSENIQKLCLIDEEFLEEVSKNGWDFGCMEYIIQNIIDQTELEKLS